MSKVVFLDTGVLGFITHPEPEISGPCVKWLHSLLDSDVRVCFAEICDYELRRKLVQIESLDAIAKLDTLKELLTFVEINTAAMQKAAQLWAQSRKSGKSTSSDKDLDADVIQCAQALHAAENGDDLVVASDNVRHLAFFLSARPYAEVVR